jgi:isoleucyl-tRNA synthetase
MTLHTALVTVAKIAAPMIPFMAEDIYRNLVCSHDDTAPESVHLCEFPAADTALIDQALEAGMKDVLDIVVLGRAARNGAACKNRQPLGKMYVQMEAELDGFFADIIADELNIKSVERITDAGAFMSYSFKPQLKTVGPKYGKQLGEIRQALTELDGNAAMAELEQNGVMKLTVGDTVCELTKEDLLIESSQMPGFESLSDKGITVVMDKNLTPALIEEGNVRELISKIQTMRKDSGFEVMGHIQISLSGSEAMLAVADRNKAEICEETLADSLTVSGDALAFSKEWNINGEKVVVSVAKI